MIFDRARAKTGASGALRLWICGLAAALAAALAGCSTNQNVANGTTVVTVNSQATGDFSTYIVGISLYSMTRSDGYIAYPAGYTYEEFADLTQRVDLTELLNAVGVPTGTYKSIVIGIDYSEPIVYIKGETGEAIVQSTAGSIDPGIIYVTVNFDPAHQLVINLNQSTPLALDFNLAAGNTVNVASNAVTVHPFVEAVTPSNDTEQVRARGLFVVGNTTQTGPNSFVEDIRPFEDNIYATVGALTVNTTSSTYYNIDGAVYTGANGLAALDKVAANTPIEAYGSLDGSPPGSYAGITPQFTATQVYAGTVVSNGEYEHIRGIVTGISGTTLTVGNATYLYYEGYCLSNLCYTYYPSVTVDVSPTTTFVTEDGTPAASFNTQSISVGSQIDAIGVNSTPSASVPTLDATQGVVRLQSTPVWGTLASGTAGSATLSLLSLGNTDLYASSFTFAGTGTASANDATAANYAIDTSAASTTAPSTGPDLSAIPAGSLLRVDGFPTAFGSGPPDFTATAVTPGTSEPANLIVEWSFAGAGTTTPFSSYDATTLALNLANSTLATVVTGPQCASGETGCTAGLPVTAATTINITGATQFAIGNSTGGIAMFSSPSAFVSDASSLLNGVTTVYRLVAIGSYDAGTNTFTASRVIVSIW